MQTSTSPASSPATDRVSCPPLGYRPAPDLTRRYASTTPQGPPDPGPAHRGPVRSAPPPKRPHGRLFVAALLLGLLGTLVYSGWNSWFRYELHGVVVGRLLRVSPPWNGTLHTVHVREGDRVRQGQRLITFESTERAQQLARAGDELLLAQAELQARLVELRWQTQLAGDRNQKAQGEYYEMWGRLLEEQSQLAKDAAELRRLELAADRDSRAVSKKELDEARFRLEGQQANVEKLELAVGEMRRRVEIYEQLNDDPSAQFRPQLTRIENLQAQLCRLRSEIQQGEVTAPANGTVLKLHRYAGEYAEPADTVVELVEQGSLQPVLYVPQDRSTRFARGSVIEIQDAAGRDLMCRVERVGDRAEPAPLNIQTYYRKDVKLLPIVLSPLPGEPTSGFVLHGEVKLPRRWSYASVPDVKAEHD